MRVVAGTAGGLQLRAPSGLSVRPTGARVREAVFNALDSLGLIEGAEVLDAFAGTGALGIEALSRGAARATFVDDDVAARACVSDNLDACGLAERARVIAGRVESHLTTGAGRYDLVLADPPYGYDRWAELAGLTEPHLAEDAVLATESDTEPVLPPGWRVLRSREYGSTVVVFAQPGPRGPRPNGVPS